MLFRKKSLVFIFLLVLLLLSIVLHVDAKKTKRKQTKKTKPKLPKSVRLNKQVQGRQERISGIQKAESKKVEGCQKRISDIQKAERKKVQGCQKRISHFQKAKNKQVQGCRKRIIAKDKQVQGCQKKIIAKNKQVQGCQKRVSDILKAKNKQISQLKNQKDAVIRSLTKRIGNTQTSKKSEETAKGRKDLQQEIHELKKERNRDYGDQLCVFAKVSENETITSNSTHRGIAEDVCSEQFTIRFIEMEPYSSGAAKDLLKESLTECCGNKSKPLNIIAAGGKKILILIDFLRFVLILFTFWKAVVLVSVSGAHCYFGGRCALLLWRR